MVRSEGCGEPLSPFVVQDVRLGVEHIETEVRRRYEYPALPVPERDFFKPVDEVRASAVVKGEVREGVGIRVEDLQAGGCPDPSHSMAVFHYLEDQVAAKRVLLFLVVVETYEVQSVEAVQTVVGRDPQHAVAALEKVVDLRAGKPAAGIVQSSRLGVQGSRNRY